jgi:hypothetical protein
MTPKTLLLPNGIVQRGASSLGGRRSSPTAPVKRVPEPLDDDDERDEKTIPFVEVSAPPRPASAPPRLAPVERAAPGWAGMVALAGLILGVSMASFAAGVRVSAAKQPGVAPSSSYSMGVANGMPPATFPIAPAVPLEAVPSVSAARVYTPDELPAAPSDRAHVRAPPSSRP